MDIGNNMKTPEPTEAQNDEDYRQYLSGHCRTAAGYLLLIVGLDAVYKAMEVTCEERREAGRILPGNPDDKE